MSTNIVHAIYRLCFSVLVLKEYRGGYENAKSDLAYFIGAAGKNMNKEYKVFAY